MGGESQCTSRYSSANTMTQHRMATLKRLAPRHAAMIPMTKASAPAMGDCVAWIMAGNVMTESVT